MKPAAVMLACALALTPVVGCSEDTADHASDGGPSDTSSTTPRAQTSPSGSVEPDATGPQFTEPTFSFRAPEGWVETDRDESDPEVFTFTVKQPATDVITNISVETWSEYEFTDVSRPARADLEYFRSYAEQGRSTGVVDWGGQRAYHFVGDDPTYGHLEWFGVLHKNKHISIQFLLEKMTPAQQQQVIASVEESWEWR